MRDKHRYYANAIGFVAFCALLAIIAKGCSDHLREIEKTKQLEIINSSKK